MKSEEPLNEQSRSGPRADALIGRVVAGRYKITRLIARGGMGAVYQAEQLPLGRAVALKVLHEPANNGENVEFDKRFLLEASSLAKLSHPHTVTLHDYGQAEDGTFFLVMEYVDGRPLSQLLQSEGPMAPDRAVRIMLQVARAVRNAHRHGIVHRDLKPSNLLVARNADGEDVVKVVDFGLAKLSEGDQAITVSGMILGSPHCMAPEQIQGGEIDERADLYALGVLLFRCVTGQYPFHGTTSTATMIAHLQAPLPSLASAAPNLVFPDGLEEVIHRCLAKRAEDRYPDAGELIKALSAIGRVGAEEQSAISAPSASLRMQGPVVVPPPVAPPPVASRERPWGLVALAALAVGALFGLLVLALAPGRPEEPVVKAPPAVTTVPVAVSTTPAGAKVSVDGAALGVTPLRVSLEGRGAPDLRSFEVSLDGFVPVMVERDLSQGQVELNLTLKPLVVEPVEATPPTAPPPAETSSGRPKADRPKPKAQEGSDTPKPPVKTEEGPPSDQSAPAGYKANPFD
ncbi:protein kinase [Myxococcota bacterium]|nr:protein kinase [Myxococcota bacterium]